MKTTRFPLALFLLVTFILVMAAFDARAGGNDSNAESSADSFSDSSAISDSSATSMLTGGDNIGGSLTGGNSNVNISGDKNRAYAVANSLGDVDIAGCLGSTQWNTPLFGKQKLVINWPCLAEFYLRNGLYDNAAMAICNTEVRQEFETEQDCRDAHPFEAMAYIPEPEITETEEDEDHRRFQAEIEALAARLSASEEKTAQAKAEARKARRAAQAPPQNDDYERRRQAAKAILEGEK